ncbi:spindle and kinetochore-associated protein 1 homolog [Olea europaea var. sylvestris]|uniref:spindle and kinetochore-associated protein 1 homolog n=1 Tax=Olea europaea var. sylvestris TaxID=158386 RepID=UPI000C1D8309|nr:spindle and kinetochore-associated protein 1 homolog [Olea europaea var. sylvestris]
MDVKQAGSSLDSLISSFNTRIVELQQFVIARNMYPASSISDLSEIDSAVKGMELQVQKIKDRLREETQALPKAKLPYNLFKDSLIRHAFALEPSMAPFQRQYTVAEQYNSSTKISRSSPSTMLMCQFNLYLHAQSLQEKKGRASPPMWYITSDELDALPSYMKQRLTLDKVNAAINDMATYAEANAQIIMAPRKKLSENMLDRALELREISRNDVVKGKHFFLEADIKGPALKLDNTGKATLTVLRHLGRISESRIGHHRVIILLKPQ